MSMRIYTSGAIEVNRVDTGLHVVQTATGTVVYSPERRDFENNRIIAAYKEHNMPHARYSLDCNNPASGVAGRDQFEADIVRLVASLKMKPTCKGQDHDKP